MGVRVHPRVPRPNARATAVTFPRTDLTYRSSLLWLYFRNRIPSLEQLRASRDSRLEGIDPNDHALLLARFGGRVITDPFTLTPLGDPHAP